MLNLNIKLEQVLFTYHLSVVRIVILLNNTNVKMEFSVM